MSEYELPPLEAMEQERNRLRRERDDLRSVLSAIVAWWDEPLPGVPYLDGMVIRIAAARSLLAAPSSPVTALRDDAE